MTEQADKSTTYRVVVYEREWTPVRHFARKVIQKTRNLCNAIGKQTQKVNEEYQQQKQFTKEIFQEGKKKTTYVLQNYPFVVLGLFSTFVAFRSRKYFSTLGCFRNGLITFAVASILCYPQHAAPLLTHPVQVVRDKYNSLIKK